MTRRPSSLYELIGERDAEDIAADAEASADEVRYLATIDKRAAVMHPNVPADLFRELARTHPLEAIQNISYPLLVLEDPYAWELLELKMAQRWVYETLQERRDLCDKMNAWAMREAMTEWTKSGYAKMRRQAWEEIVSAYFMLTGKQKKDFSIIARLQGHISRKPIDSVFPESAFNALLRGAVYSLWTRDYTGAMSQPGMTLRDLRHQAPSYFCDGQLHGFLLAKADGFYGQALQDAVHGDQDIVKAILSAGDRQSVVQWHHLLDLLHYSEQYKKVFAKVKEGYANAFREGFYGPEAKREATVQQQIKEALADMDANTKEIVRIVQRADGWGWPDYLMIGVAVGGLVLVVAAPQLFVVYGVMAAEGYATRTAALTIAEQVAAMAARAELSAVTIEFGKVAATAAQSQFVKELAVKLAASGLAAKAPDVVQAIVKVTR